MSATMSNTAEEKELADIQIYAHPDNIPLGEIRRLLNLHELARLEASATTSTSGGSLRLHKQTIDEYISSDIHVHRVLYYGDPIDMVKTREKQGLQPTTIKCVKTNVHRFDVAQFNKQLLERGFREASRHGQHGIVVIREPDEQAAKEIIAKTEEKLLTLPLENRDKFAIINALLAQSVETRLVKDDIIENLQAIGYIVLDEKDGETSVTYKLTTRLGAFVKRMLECYNQLVTSCCNLLNNKWDSSPAVFRSDVQRTCMCQNLDQTGLELLKPESLQALELLEHMGKSRPKTLKSFERIIQSASRSVAITPMNMTFAKLVDTSPKLKTVLIPFGDPPVFPFSLSTKDMFVVPWKAVDDPAVTAKETKKFCRRVFSNFKRKEDHEMSIQYGLADAVTRTEAVKTLQLWLENREKGVESDCERNMEDCNATSDVLHYKLSCLAPVEGLTHPTREDIYGIITRMSNTEVTYSQQEVVKRLEELGVLKAHPDKVVFFVKQMRRLVKQAEAANKKVADHVSNSLERYYANLETKKNTGSK